MEKKQGFRENLEVALDYLEKFLKTETVVGEPIIVGDVTIIPLVTVSFGAGGAGGSGTEKGTDQGAGSGAGFGGKITTDAVLVIKEGNVNIIPVKGRNDIDRLVALVPDILGKFIPKKKEEVETEVPKEEV